VTGNTPAGSDTGDAAAGSGGPLATCFRSCQLSVASCPLR
jgi:hypothetical protein